MEEYKWDSPFEWLSDKANKWTSAEQLEALLSIALQVDCDTIQDIFQSEMAEDNYFDKL